MTNTFYDNENLDRCDESQIHRFETAPTVIGSFLLMGSTVEINTQPFNLMSYIHCQTYDEHTGQLFTLSRLTRDQRRVAREALYTRRLGYIDNQ